MTDRQLDFFIPSIADPPLRDQLDLMDLPLLSLAKTKRTKPIEFRRVTTKGEVRATVTSGPGGIATIQDYDVLIWATSHIMAAKQAGLATAAKIDGASAYEILKFTGRSTGPRAYGLLWSAIDRLVDTTIRTSVRTERGGRDAVFHWLERADKTVNAAGKVTGLSITLPQWLYQGIENNNVLSISADYFNLTGGLERWLYRLTRKRAGNQRAGWNFTFGELYDRSGSAQKPKEFARDLRKIIERDGLPDYHLEGFEGQRGDACLHAVRRTLLPSSHPAHDFRLLTGKKRTRPAF